ncbi:MAG: M1 family metallopeptidase [Bacteroidetes bacterium]|nr:M1 family metallopeptidase [Bacteroidota bacterium]
MAAVMPVFSQLLDQKKTFSRADTLRGSLRPERTCYDVQFYELRVKVDTVHQSISGSSEIFFKAVTDITTMQIDLRDSMEIDDITYKGKRVYYSREYDAVFLAFPKAIPAGSETSVLVRYHGTPVKAKRAPWDGGFVWRHDQKGKFWLGVACEGLGASSWWPCKDHLSDEPDKGIRIIVTFPRGLQCVTNGQDMGDIDEGNWTTHTSLVTYPINTYNVTLNIGDYVHWEDEYVATDGQKLKLNYDVMSYNLEKSKKQFEVVKPMLKTYEKYLGKYPFWRDGYRLVETYYLGMEHQSCIAYGNHYKMGYDGTDFSRMGLWFDYIIVHESGHEWWGNSVSANDIADMWIHEGFCTYTESMFIEDRYGKDTAILYINAKKSHVENKAPIQGQYLGVNEEGSGDMYNKGSLMLNTLRTVVNNDALWWQIIKGVSDTAFKYKTTDANEIISYFNKKSGMNLTPIFDQYLKYPAIPRFAYTLRKIKGKKYELIYFWLTDVKDFTMPVRITTAGGAQEWLPASNMIGTKVINLNSENDFKVDQNLGYFNIERR